MQRHFTGLVGSLTGLLASDSIGGVKWLLIGALALLQCSCTTSALTQRRDLYGPDPAPGATPYLSSMTAKAQEELAPPPQFR